VLQQWFSCSTCLWSPACERKVLWRLYCVSEEGEVGACVWGWVPQTCFNQNSSGNEDCYRKGPADPPFYNICFNLFLNSCSCICILHAVLLDPFCDGKTCFSHILYWDQGLFLESFSAITLNHLAFLPTPHCHKPRK